MDRYDLSHVADSTVLANTKTIVAGRRGLTADLLAHLVAIEARRLYAPMGYSSMYQYCVGELHLSGQTAVKSIRVARMARRFPAIFTAVAQGRVHLSGLILVKPHMTRRTADELLAATTHKTCKEIELLLAHRFPQPDLPTCIRPIAAARPCVEIATQPVELAAQPPAIVCGEIQVAQLSARTVRVTSEPSTPIAPSHKPEPVSEPVATTAYPRITPIGATP